MGLLFNNKLVAYSNIHSYSYYSNKSRITDEVVISDPAIESAKEKQKDDDRYRMANKYRHSPPKMRFFGLALRVLAFKGSYEH